MSSFSSSSSLSEGVIAARRIQICLFLLELSLAFFMIMVAYVILSVLPFSLYWASGLCSTMVIVWLVKSIVEAIETLRNRVVALDTSNAKDDNLLSKNDNDVLKSFEEIQERRLESQFNNEEDSKSASFDAQKSSAPTEYSQTKQFLMDMEDEKNEPIETIVFHLLSILATVLLQIAIRILVIVQNVRRSRTRRRAKSDTMKFSDIPFTIGRNMSSSGASFHIFSFLNGWLECGDENNPDSHVREGVISIKAVSFDRISVGSSFITIYPPRQHPSARSQLSWLGISFKDIEFSLAIHLKVKNRTTSEGICANIAQSILLQLKLDAFEVGFFPFVVDWCRSSGMHMNVVASSNSGVAPEHGLIDFDASSAMNRICMYRFTSRSPPVGPNSKSKASIISWDAIQSSLHLHAASGLGNGSNKNPSTRKPVSLMKLPSGYTLLYDSRCENLRRKLPPLPRCAYMTIGGSSCMNMLAVGVHMENLHTFLNEGEVQFQCISDSIIRNRSTKLFPVKNEKVKTKSSMNIIQVNATIALQLYALQSTPRGDSSNDGVTHDYFTFQGPRLDILWTNDAQVVPDTNVEQRNGASFPLLQLVTQEFRLRHEEFPSDILDEIRVAASDPVVITRIRAKLLITKSPLRASSMIAIVGWNCIVVRAGVQVTNKLTSLKNSLEVIKRRVAAIQSIGETQQYLSHIDDPDSIIQSSTSTENTKQNSFERIEVSFGSLDVIVDLFQSSKPTDADGIHGIDSDDALRMAFYQQETSIIISKKQTISKETTDTSDSLNNDLLPEQLFYSAIDMCGDHYFTEASIVLAEGSVTFSPHSSLPVIDDDVPTSYGCLNRHQKVSYYGKVTNAGFLTAVPRKSMLSSKMSSHVSKALYVSFRSLDVYERLEKIAKIDTSLKLSSTISQQIGWHTAQTADATANDVMIMQCSGSLCLAEEISKMWERTELISVQFCKGSKELEAVWSPILQWQQVSCSNSIQRALAVLSASSSKNRTTGTVLSSHTSSIRIGVESDVTATIHAFFGVKSKSCIILKGGCTMRVSMAKFPCPISKSLKQSTKPSISFQAKQMIIHLNDIPSPILVFEDMAFHNYLRRAHGTEIDDYITKKQCPDLCSDNIVTDHNGHPVKEIFELNLKGRTSAKFPPALHFGEVVDDVLLLPKALFDGLNRMKEDYKKQKPKYQLMSIKCSLSVLDISLMGYNPDSDVTMMVSDELCLAPSQPGVPRDEFRIVFEGADLSIERNSPPEWTQNQINGLDEDDATYLFGSSQGGLLSMAIKHVSCMLHPLDLNNPLVCMDDFGMNGYLHLAGLCPTNPGVQTGKIVKSKLFCHHERLNDWCFPANEVRECSCSYGVALYSSGVPVKLYTDCQFTFKQFHIVFGSVMNNSIPRLMECIQRLLPPPSKSSDEVTTPLTWWDNVRFFIHGSISLSADVFSIRWLLDAHTFWDQSILLKCNKFDVCYLVGSFTIDASTLSVSIPGVAYDTSIHPSARGANPFPCHQTDTTDSVADKRRHPLLFVPSFKSHIQFKWELLESAGVSSRHHSIYMKYADFCKHELEWKGRRDKFAAFRSDGINVQLQVELSGSDGVEADIWVALRTDVLPWLTHINSTMELLPGQNKKKADSLPNIRTITVKLRVHEMKMVTWFEDEKEMDGLCLIFKNVKYSASIDGKKEIVLDGPVKAALLDVRGFNHVEKVGGGSRDSIDFDVRDPNELEQEIKQSDMSVEVLSAPFLKLQQMTSCIDELDYVVVTDQIDIRNQSMANILSVDDVVGNLKESQSFAGVDGNTWSILVARCRLLWTIAIRDSIMTISKDLIYTVGFMKSQQRQLQLLSGGASGEDHDESEHCEISAASLVRVAGQHESRHTRSTLDYLLDGSFDEDFTEQATAGISVTLGDTDIHEQNPTLPTLEIHFSNPQVQLHSIATGGSIIVAMESADVEARKFVHLLVANLRSNGGGVGPSDLLIKTEQTYTLTNMEAFSHNTRVDVNVGLPWLEVRPPYMKCLVTQQSVPLAERFGIDESVVSQITVNNECTGNDDTSVNPEDRFVNDFLVYSHSSDDKSTYPSGLRPHEPLAFVKSGLLRPILDKFTFQSRQLFHRPPIHNSTRELVHFLKQGLVVGQNEAAVDDTELHIDLLNFNLDSYQFKTTIDVIRNVLLEVQKPYRRREFIDHDNTTSSRETLSRVTSAAAIQMEDLLREESRYQGKKGRQLLRTAAMGLMQETEDKILIHGDAVFRRISYRLSKLQSCIRSHDEIDDVQIDFTGFHGQHDYSTIGSVVSQFSLEDLRVSSSRPSPDSIGFLDPTSIVKSILGNERSPCVRCDQYFNPSDNDANSCVFHIGQYKYGAWKCCKSTNALAPGCKTGPHSGKERAAVIRVETLPRTVEGISLYSHFEVNLFPGIPHKLVLQISKSMSRLLMSYFFVEDDYDDDIDSVLTVSDDTSAMSDSFSTPSDFSPKPHSRKKAMLIGGKGMTSSGIKRVNESMADSIKFKSNSIVESPKKRPEIVFVKVWRVGYVDVDISLGGFKRLPVTSLDICVPAYSKAYEIGTWEYLGKKYLSHLVREVLKSGASSGLDKFRRKVMGGAASPSPAGQRGDLLESVTSFETNSTPPIPLPRLPTMSTDSDSAEPESSIGAKLWGRPKGASDILGTPVKKKRSLFSKHSR